MFQVTGRDKFQVLLTARTAVVVFSLGALLAVGCGSAKSSHSSTTKDAGSTTQVAAKQIASPHAELCESTGKLVLAVDDANQEARKTGVTTKEGRAQLGEALGNANSITIKALPANVSQDDVQLYDLAHDYQTSLTQVSAYFRGASSDSSMLNRNNEQYGAVMKQWMKTCQ